MEKKVNEWFVLAILIVCFVPVVIDATVLHMAIPSLTFDLKASGNQVLWMIDIYSLIMAGLLLPMGVLGDKFGHKRLLFMGVIVFTLASLLAGFSQTPVHLIAARVLLAVGGSMIMPTTLAVIKQNFPDDKKRAIALGIWVVFANAGAAIGPVFGGLLIDYLSWRAIFFINIPFLLPVIPFVWFKLPVSFRNAARKWSLRDTVIILSAVILLVYFIKNVFKQDGSLWLNISIGLAGLVLMLFFIRIQKKSDSPMLDRTLFKDKRVQLGMVFTFMPMAVTSGFELLLSQELQLVHEVSASRTALYITPFFLAFAAPGLFSRWFMKKIGVFRIKAGGLMLTAGAFILLSQIDFSSFTFMLALGLVAAGFGLGIIMLAASYAIISAANDENAGTAGSLEATAYELGVGLGVTFFGVLLSQVFMTAFHIDAQLAAGLPKEMYYSINDALIVAENIGGNTGEVISNAARSAFQ